MTTAKRIIPLLIILFLLCGRMPSMAQVTLWETYQAAGHQAIQDRRVADAERLLLAAAKQVKAVSPDDPRLGNTFNDLGVLYGMENRDVEAEAIFQQALAINEKAFGRQHPSVVLTMQNLSVIYASQNKFSEAHRMARESLEISLRLFGSHHPRIGSTCRTLATVYALEGNYKEAERFAKKSVTIFENTLGEHHRETAQSLEMMTRILWTTHRDSEAQILEARLNTIRQDFGTRSHVIGSNGDLDAAQ